MTDDIVPPRGRGVKLEIKVLDKKKKSRFMVYA